ncbi:carboxypeptidase [Methylobacterium indicum]|uniref:M20 family metallopeptidase n=1 Tax=Methylobacterium indicum TaxID=1775910 RepID=UPI0007345325|nr:M20 family metallopeptidase [Methylobacterium indicum]KTS30419.1 carboxypeptidase [Methylobacterium indicum]KTS31916.1 carboxypeptidase [Methylobacterium indicum]KTS45572.1 carboxypeptidase [Methylobacterium indicum]
MTPSPHQTDLSPERAVAAISRWLAVESPTDSAEGVNRMMDLVAGEAADLGLTAERVPGRDGFGDNLILRAGPRNGEPGLLVLSHLDTVHPIGTLANDLPVRVEGDRLYGPGVYDMKGGAWLALQAFAAAAHGGLARRPLTFLFSSDEETGSASTRGLIEDLGRTSAAVLVTEPGRDGGKVVTGRKGVGRFDVHVEGRPSHAGTRHADGRNAIREAARLILEIEGLTDYARGVTTTVGTILGGTAENVVPQHCRFAVDLRVVTAADGQDYAGRILGLSASPDFRVTVTGGMNRPPYDAEAGAALYAHAKALARDELGLDLGEVPLTGGGSDGNFTAALGIPTLDGLGIDGDGAHTLQEYGLISSIAPRLRLMQRLLETL